MSPPTTKTCTQCKHTIEAGQTMTETNGRCYHRECFICDECKKPIEGSFFPATKSNADQHVVNICQQCRMKQMPSRNCSICKQSVQGVDDSLVHENKVFHRKCFICRGCNQPITSSMSFRLCADDNNKPECKGCAEKGFNKKCQLCNKVIPIEGMYMQSDQKFWHHECFCCSKCKKQITDGKYREVDDKGTIHCAACSV